MAQALAPIVGYAICKNYSRRHFGKIAGNTMFVVYMQRSLWPHSGTIRIVCFAPSVSVTYLKNASPRDRRVGPCAIAVGDLSKPPSGSVSTCPNRYVVG